MIDLVGHIGEVFLLIGVLLLSQKDSRGWLFRIVGQMIWIVIGFKLAMTSIWVWCLIFFMVDIRGYNYANKDKLS